MRARSLLLRRLLVPWLALVAVVGVVSAASPERQDDDVVEVRSDGPTTSRGATTTAPAPTTTTLPPTTTTAPPPPPPPTTTAAPRPEPAAPAPAPPTTAAPEPSPAPAPAPSAAATADYAMALVREVIPARWLAVLPVQVNVIAGKTSWSSWGGLIEIGDWHLTSSVQRAKSVLAHEWGHQVAWHYGTDVYNGAPPAGFPYAGPIPEEMWADCVAQALTGWSNPSHGLGGCPGGALSFASSYLAAGPGPRLR
jgi:hypothetical protein